MGASRTSPDPRASTGSTDPLVGSAVADPARWEHVAMCVHTITATEIGLFAAYIVAMDWVPIPRWNRNVSTEAPKMRIVSSLWHGSLGVLFATGNALRLRW